MTTLTLTAPVRGWCAALDEAPDAVFAERLLGDGVAIDPTGDTLFAPCDGTVTSVAPSRHALVIRAVNDAEVLLHVGIDTVDLAGEGFCVLVEAGARVRAGDPLLRFDLDVLACSATSLLTPVIVTNGERFRVTAARCGRAVEVGEPLFAVEPVAGDPAGAATPDADVGGEAATERLVIAFEHGIHARPAGLIADLARSIASPVTVAAHGRSASASSPVALMSLGVRHGDEVILRASGPEASRSLRELKRRILDLPDSLPLTGRADQPPPSSPEATVSGATTAGTTPGNRLRGVIASRGFTVGRAFTLARIDIVVEQAGRGMAYESAALERARADVAAHLRQLADGAGAAAREVMNAHLALLDDPELTAAARRVIAQGGSAAFAWRQAIADGAEALQALGQDHLDARVDDLLDLESQVLLALRGDARAPAERLPDRAILVAAELTPSQLVSLDSTRLAGICTAAGGATSHVAILAAAMGVPALAALGPELLAVDDGAWLVLDAEHGELDVAPDHDTLAAAERRLSRQRQRAREQHAAAHAECRTADGTPIGVLANLGSVADARMAVDRGAEGCGLLRSEFLFLDRDRPPDEDEQLRHYREIAAVLAGRPLVVRTLDIGGDKPIPYLPLPAEANPSLGLRGVRTSLWRPDLLRVQMRAILRVEPPQQCRVLVPMVTELSELLAVRRLLDEARRELDRRPLPVGVMIETPASALIADRLAAHADFLSIGTNDLAQYTLAMDRDHAELATRIDGLHPGLLRLIAMTVEGAARHHRPVTVCGGLASDPAAVPVLLGLGVRELSVIPAMVPEIKSLIRAWPLDACRSLAASALTLDSAAEVRELIADSCPTSGSRGTS